MRSELKKMFILTIILAGTWTINSCKKDKEDSISGTDKELYDMAKGTTGFTWFKNSDSLLNKSSGSGHPQPFLRTRYNTVASSQLDSTGRIMTGALFPEGSLIVKELHDNSTTL